MKINQISSGKSQAITFEQFEQGLFFPLDYEVKFSIEMDVAQQQGPLQIQAPSTGLEESLAYKLEGLIQDIPLVQAQNIMQDSDSSEICGSISHILILRKDQKYILRGTDEQLRKIRVLLSSAINQIGFHQYFNVFKKLGSGGEATVFLAQKIEDGKLYAIRGVSKKYCKQGSDQEKALQNQIGLLRKLSHKGIIALDSIYETNNSLYMCMEFLEGGSLEKLLQRNTQQFTDQQIKELMLSLLQGLDYLHSQGIMHRDIKPGNIMLRDSENLSTAVIIDLGLSTYVNPTYETYINCGTLGQRNIIYQFSSYMAPEVKQAKTLNYDQSCDIYSLGIVFHIMYPFVYFELFFRLAGRKPTIFQIDCQQEFMINWEQNIYKQINPCALNLLQAMLYQNPSKRISARFAMSHSFIGFTIANSITLKSLDYDIDDDDDDDDESLIWENILKYQMNITKQIKSYGKIEPSNGMQTVQEQTKN